MNECYIAALWAGTTLIIAWSVGSIVGTVIGELIASWLDKRAIRKENQRINQLIADEKAQSERYRAPTQ